MGGAVTDKSKISAESLREKMKWIVAAFTTLFVIACVLITHEVNLQEGTVVEQEIFDASDTLTQSQSHSLQTGAASKPAAKAPPAKKGVAKAAKKKVKKAKKKAKKTAKKGKAKAKKAAKKAKAKAKKQAAKKAKAKAKKI